MRLAIEVDNIVDSCRLGVVRFSGSLVIVGDAYGRIDALPFILRVLRAYANVILKVVSMNGISAMWANLCMYRCYISLSFYKHIKCVRECNIG